MSSEILYTNSKKYNNFPLYNFKLHHLKLKVLDFFFKNLNLNYRA